MSAARKVKPATPKAEAAPALLTPGQFARIEKRLDVLIGDIYIAANMASIMQDARRDADLELAQVLGHMSKLLLKVAESISADQIVPFAERVREVSHGE